MLRFDWLPGPGRPTGKASACHCIIVYFNFLNSIHVPACTGVLFITDIPYVCILRSYFIFIMAFNYVIQMLAYKSDVLVLRLVGLFCPCSF